MHFFPVRLESKRKVLVQNNPARAPSFGEMAVRYILWATPPFLPFFSYFHLLLFTKHRIILPPNSIIYFRIFIHINKKYLHTTRIHPNFAHHGISIHKPSKHSCSRRHGKDSHTSKQRWREFYRCCRGDEQKSECYSRHSFTSKIL